MLRVSLSTATSPLLARCIYPQFYNTPARSSNVLVMAYQVNANSIHPTQQQHDYTLYHSAHLFRNGAFPFGVWPSCCDCLAHIIVSDRGNNLRPSFVFSLSSSAPPPPPPPPPPKKNYIYRYSILCNLCTYLCYN